MLHALKVHTMRIIFRLLYIQKRGVRNWVSSVVAMHSVHTFPYCYAFHFIIIVVSVRVRVVLLAAAYMHPWKMQSEIDF